MYTISLNMLNTDYRHNSHQITKQLFYQSSYFTSKLEYKCNDKNGAGKIQTFIRSTKTNSPSSNIGAISLPPMGNSFMYIETTIMDQMYSSARKEQKSIELLI